MIIGSGIGFGLIYFVMNNIQTGLMSQDCAISGNVLVSSCQELFELAVYPFLNLKDIFVWGHTWLIFGMVLGILFLGYRSGKNPYLIGINTLFILGATYLGIHVSNMYRTLLENPLFRDMMVNFVLYNRIMLGLPWFIFIIGLFSVILGIVNFQKPNINVPTTSELDY